MTIIIIFIIKIIMSSQVIDYAKIKEYAEEHKKEHPEQGEEITFVIALMRWWVHEHINKRVHISICCHFLLSSPIA